MQLHIFVHHVSEIFSTQAPAEFELHPHPGIVAKVRIVRYDLALPWDIWDQVYINGQWCGNRHGGVRYFTDMICNAAPPVEFD